MITLIPLTDSYTIYQLTDLKSVPAEIYNSGFFSVTSTGEEISVITNCIAKFHDIKSSEGLKGFKVEGILDFSLVGIIHEIIAPLKDHKIPVFVVSTFNTDYVFVRKESFMRAIELFKLTDSINVKD